MINLIDKPKPGSDEAIKLGCKCPRYDNGMGRDNRTDWIINMSCPVHTMQTAELSKMLGITE